MSSKSSQPHEIKSGFSRGVLFVAVAIGIVFLTIIIVYPRIFNPSNMGIQTAPRLTPDAGIK